MKAFLFALLLVPLASECQTPFEKQIARWAPPGTQAPEGSFSNDGVFHYFSDQPFEKVWAHYAQLLGINRPFRDNGSEGMNTVKEPNVNRIIHATGGKNLKERVSTLIRRGGGDTTTVTISQDGGRVMITVIIHPHPN